MVNYDWWNVEWYTTSGIENLYLSFSYLQVEINRAFKSWAWTASSLRACGPTTLSSEFFWLITQSFIYCSTKFNPSPYSSLLYNNQTLSHPSKCLLPTTSRASWVDFRHIYDKGKACKITYSLKCLCIIILEKLLCRYVYHIKVVAKLWHKPL